MQIFPAIDIRGGQCVRLQQGDYAKETVFEAEPAKAAQHWVAQGASYLHLVDLDGARAGRPVNGAQIERIVASANVPCQLGGGIRSDDDLRQALSWGVARVILGTRALEDPDWCATMCQRYPGRVVLGIDAKNGLVATGGWLAVSERSALEVGQTCADWRPAALVYTDISRDGMLQGPNFEATAELAAAVDVPIIASGGVTSLQDIERLARLGIPGCIVGRALYEGRLDLRAALAAAKSSAPRPRAPSLK